MDRYKGYSPRARQILKQNEPDYSFHRRKLFRGVLYCVLAYFVFFSSYSQYFQDEHGHAFKHDISAFLQRFLLLPNNAAGVISGLLVWITCPLAIWSFIAGPYNVFTYQEYYSTYDDPYPLLHQLRDVFIRLGNSTFTDFLPNGGDNHYEGEHKHLQRLADYVDGKVGGKNSDDALDFLRGKKKE